MINKKNIVIIPARKGSKRIPNKNIKEFCGNPIISYSIDAAIKSNLFDEVMVSTDSEEIAKIAISLGAKVPFLRSEKNSNDISGLSDVVIEVLYGYEKNNIKFENVCCILATVPFLSVNSLNESYEQFTKNHFDAVFSAVKYSYPIQRSFKITGNKAYMIYPENYSKRTQDMESTYHDAGQFYWIKSEKILEIKKLFTDDNTGIYLLPEKMVQDIDTEEDWEIAELKYNILNNEREK